MKIRVVSDLHFEFMRDHGVSISQEVTTNPDYDVLVVAGDIASFKGLYGALVTICQAAAPKPVVYVIGNHEGYGSTIKAVFQECHRAEATCPNLVFLEEKVQVIQGQRFVGCTLWFDHDGMPDLADASLNDFHLIRDIYEFIANKAKSSREFLVKNVQPGDVVITHHLPHPASIAPVYRGSALNRFFLHNVSSVVEKAEAALWVHGHTHTSCDYTVGKTRVVCNPFGYAQGSSGEPNPEFSGDFTVDLDAMKNPVDRTEPGV